MLFIELGSQVNGQVKRAVFDVLKMHVQVDGLVFPVLDILFGLYINYIYRHSLGSNSSKIGWLQGYFASLVMATGGGCTISLIRGEPIGILKSNEFWIIHSLAYWLMFATDLVYGVMRMLCNLPLVEYIFVVSDAYGRALTMVQYGVDGADVALGPGKWVAQFIFGVLGGAGGGFWLDSFQLAQPHWSFMTPQCLKCVSPDMKLSAVTTLLYMALKYQWIPIDIAPGAEAQAYAALFLTVGLMYFTMMAKRQAAAAAVVVTKEKKDA